MEQTNDIFEYIRRLGGDTIKSSALDVQMLVLNSSLEVFKANTSRDMKDDLLSNFLTPIANLITRGPDRGLAVVDYDPVNAPEHEVIWRLPSNDVPAFESVYDQLSRPVDEIPSYVDENGDMEGVTAIGLRIQSEHGEILVFQRIIPNYILKNSRKYGVIFNGANFSKLESPAAFQISRDNHVFYFADNLYVLNQNHFEYIFDYQEKKAAVASDKLTDVEKTYANNLIIKEGKTLMELIAGDKRAINKLQVLDYSIDLNEAVLTKIKLEWDVDIKIDASTGKMIIEEKKDVKELINILNDDYLLSDLTKGKYAASSKRKVIVKQQL